MHSSIYVFCEGSTEEIYLEHFQNRTYNVSVIPVDTEHTDAIGIVRYAKEYIKKHELDLQDGDRGYCVFDSDPDSNPNIKEAFNLIDGMREKGLDCIFSNPCYEVWFALHFGNAPYGKSAEQMKHFVKNKMRSEFGIEDYSETTDVFELLESKQDEAYNRAKRLCVSQSQVHERVHSHECNPYTDMFKFIEYMRELRAFRKCKQEQ